MSDLFFPRELSWIEKEFIFSVLPEWKPGYKKYREKINDLIVIGLGRFGNGNIVLGKKGMEPDLNFPSSAIFADGTILCEEGEVDILIHEENAEEIEIDISTPYEGKNLEDYSEIIRWNYSEWVPGNKAPYDNSDVREIIIKPGELILVIAPHHKKIWVYEFGTAVNHIIPITNFYNHLMLVKNIRESKKITQPNIFFDEHINYADKDLKSAFVFYNQYFKKVKLEVPPAPQKNNKKKFWNFFNKGK